MSIVVAAFLAVLLFPFNCNPFKRVFGAIRPSTSSQTQTNRTSVPMGMSQSISNNADTPIHSTSPSSPSTSPLNLPEAQAQVYGQALPQTQPQPPSASSFLNPLALFVSPATETPDLKHHHLANLHSEINEITSILARKLPPELIPRILDHARIWHGCRIMCTKEVCVRAGSRSPRVSMYAGSAWRNGQEEEMSEMGMEGLKDGDGNVWVLVSGPVGCREGEGEEEDGEGIGTGKRGEMSITSKRGVAGSSGDDADGEIGGYSGDDKQEGSWLREIVIETLSKDQGWSSTDPAAYGTYNASYSWFDISLFRDGVEVPDSRREIQHNVHAGQYYKPHRIVLGPDDPWVKRVKKGDRVVLWARAIYPGWQNNVRETAITVFTTPYPPT